MTPWLLLDTQQRRQTACFLAILRDVEYAHATASFQNIERVLAAVDPVELRELIQVFDSAEAEPPDMRGEPLSTSPIPPPGSSDLRVQPSASAVPSEVVHAFDTWSRKVRCG